MHPAVLDWVSQFKTTEDLRVLDIGGRDLNGSPRMFFPNAAPYDVLDLYEGPNVDIVADATTWRLPGPRGAERPFYDLVVCTEVFEHVKGWADIIQTAYEVLRPGGWFIFTCAGPGRPVHSGIQPVWGLIGDEHYANVSAEEIGEVLHTQGWEDIEVRQLGLDTQGKAVKPEQRDVLLGATLTRSA